MNKGEIIIYQPDEKSTHIDVLIDDETVWLTQSQMVELFLSSRQNISLHINNIFKEGELNQASTVKEYLTVQLLFAKKVQLKVAFYNLSAHEMLNILSTPNLSVPEIR
jgi:hypothetical protein